MSQVSSQSPLPETQALIEEGSQSPIQETQALIEEGDYYNTISNPSSPLYSPSMHSPLATSTPLVTDSESESLLKKASTPSSPSSPPTPSSPSSPTTTTTAPPTTSSPSSPEPTAATYDMSTPKTSKSSHDMATLLMAPNKRKGENAEDAISDICRKRRSTGYERGNIKSPAQILSEQMSSASGARITTSGTQPPMPLNFGISHSLPGPGRVLGSHPTRPFVPATFAGPSTFPSNWQSRGVAMLWVFARMGHVWADEMLTKIESDTQTPDDMYTLLGCVGAMDTMLHLFRN